MYNVYQLTSTIDTNKDEFRKSNIIYWCSFKDENAVKQYVADKNDEIGQYMFTYLDEENINANIIMYEDEEKYKEDNRQLYKTCRIIIYEDFSADIMYFNTLLTHENTLKIIDDDSLIFNIPLEYANEEIIDYGIKLLYNHRENFPKAFKVKEKAKSETITINKPTIPILKEPIKF